jgi:hypothetical protein
VSTLTKYNGCTAGGGNNLVRRCMFMLITKGSASPVAWSSTTADDYYFSKFRFDA